MKKILAGAIMASTLTIIAITQASAQNTAEYSLAATGEQTHDSQRTSRQALNRSRTGAVILPNARYGMAAPNSVDQSSYPSGTYDFGFSGGGGGNSRYGALPVVSTSSVDINSVDLGRNSNQSTTQTASSGTTLPPATNPTGNPNNPFDLNTILANSGVKLPQLPSLPNSLPSLPSSPGWPTGLPNSIPSLPNGLPPDIFKGLPGTSGLPADILKGLPGTSGLPADILKGLPGTSGLPADILKGLPGASGLPNSLPSKLPAGVPNLPGVISNIGDSGF